MKSEKFNDALDFLDYELVDEFVKEKEALKQRKIKRKAIATFVPIAACFVILLSVGTALLGYNLGSNNNVYEEMSQEQLQILFGKEGRFVFEYGGKVYQAFVTPIFSGEGVNFTESEMVSIRDVGELISTVEVTDENGNTATMEIYSNNKESSQEGVLLKLDSGYFLAEGID